MNARTKKSVNKSYGPFSGTASKMLAFDLTETIFESVPAALYEHVKLRVEQNLRCLETHDHVQPEKLVGEDCWNEFDDEEKRMAEICIGYLCQSGAVPLRAYDFGLTPPLGYGFPQSDKTV